VGHGGLRAVPRRGIRAECLVRVSRGILPENERILALYTYALMEIENWALMGDFSNLAILCIVD